ncbi:fasciclin domain-containing protein [Rhodobacter calidifons]|uniref:Fasciclin domain-containing protein n=1 Tax=Rhodobacter calidifons TaxID=2715277 RepID=A0ABX0G2F2_9RHOB|nr:fasciclin domain-containing protein [Rhodobacter calidifons]NHB75384.1 fasciclin domain-containing protein [Rhodobacter calidifons]
MSLKSILGAVALSALATSAFAANPDVGGAPMFESKNIVENAVNSKDHTTLVAAVKAAGLVDALMGPGPFTVFAPVNDAFAALPAGTVETLLKPENKAMLTKVLTAHVVAGDLKLADLRRKVGKDGFANLRTLSGDALSVKFKGDKAMVYSESRNIGTITIADVDQSNGVIHVIDTVLVPK